MKLNGNDSSNKLVNLIKSALKGKSDNTHNHDSVYSKLGHTHSYASTSHTHDDRYYTESEIINLLNGKANNTHTHFQFTATSNWADADLYASYLEYIDTWILQNGYKIMIGNIPLYENAPTKSNFLSFINGRHRIELPYSMESNTYTILTNYNTKGNYDQYNIKILNQTYTYFDFNLILIDYIESGSALADDIFLYTESENLRNIGREDSTASLKFIIYGK